MTHNQDNGIVQEPFVGPFWSSDSLKLHLSFRVDPLDKRDCDHRGREAQGLELGHLLGGLTSS